MAAIGLALLIASAVSLATAQVISLAPVVGLLAFAMGFTVLAVLLAPVLHRAVTGWQAGRH